MMHDQRNIKLPNKLFGHHIYTYIIIIISQLSNFIRYCLLYLL